MRRHLLALVAALGAVAAGCTAEPDADRVTYLILQQPAIGVLDAYLESTVSITDDCPLLAYSSDLGVQLQRAIWPDGTRFDPVADVITLPDGRSMRDGDEVTGGGGSENFGGSLDAYDDLFQPDSITQFSTTCRDSELATTEWFIIAPDSIKISTS